MQIYSWIFQSPAHPSRSDGGGRFIYELSNEFFLSDSSSSRIRQWWFWPSRWRGEKRRCRHGCVHLVCRRSNPTTPEEAPETFRATSLSHGRDFGKHHPRCHPHNRDNVVSHLAHLRQFGCVWLRLRLLLHRVVFVHDHLEVLLQPIEWNGEREKRNNFDYRDRFVHGSFRWGHISPSLSVVTRRWETDAVGFHSRVICGELRRLFSIVHGKIQSGCKNGGCCLNDRRHWCLEWRNLGVQSCHLVGHHQVFHWRLVSWFVDCYGDCRLLGLLRHGSAHSFDFNLQGSRECCNPRIFPYRLLLARSSNPSHKIIQWICKIQCFGFNANANWMTYNETNYIHTYIAYVILCVGMYKYAACYNVIVSYEYAYIITYWIHLSPIWQNINKSRIQYNL